MNAEKTHKKLTTDVRNENIQEITWIYSWTQPEMILKLEKFLQKLFQKTTKEAEQSEITKATLRRLYERNNKGCH